MKLYEKRCNNCYSEISDALDETYRINMYQGSSSFICPHCGEYHEYILKSYTSFIYMKLTNKKVPKWKFWARKTRELIFPLMMNGVRYE